MTTIDTPAPAEDLVLRPGPAGTVDIIGALIEAMRIMPGVGKDSRHQGERGSGGTGQWSYRSADAVVTAAGPALAAAGVLCIPNLVGDTPIQLGNQDGIRIAMEYRFFAADGSSVTVHMVAHGVGRTAYTIGAAYSYAFKYALSQALAIPFDDPRLDQESTETGRAMEEPPEVHVDAAEVEELLVLIQGLNEEQRAQVKAEGAARARPGRYSWSFLPEHRWTVIELRDARAYILSLAGAEPWDDAPAPPADSVSTSTVGYDDLLAAGILAGHFDTKTGVGLVRRRLVTYAREITGNTYESPEALIADQDAAEQVLAALRAQVKE